MNIDKAGKVYGPAFGFLLKMSRNYTIYNGAKNDESG